MGKIAILTQPLHDNYGGLLQAFALKESLQKIGHDVTVVDRRSPQPSILKLALSKFKKKLLNQKINSKLYLSEKERRVISQHTSAFRKKYIPNMTNPITDNAGMQSLNSMGFNAYVVGSDQCWRPRYSPQITNYFLDFAQDEEGIKRISYAASFGVSDWEFEEETTNVCARLIQKFDAISVREESAVDLVKKYLNQEAIHVLDPTMLLNREDYIKIAEDENTTSNLGELKVYILDRTKEKQDIVNNIENSLGISKFEVLPKKRLGRDQFDDIQDFVYPGPVQWLQGYRDAKFVVTDSFHGSVFSILFNIPFLVIPNNVRGGARFESLLSKFGLEERLVKDTKKFDFEHVINSKINWGKVNCVIEEEREKAINFLKLSLS